MSRDDPMPGDSSLDEVLAEEMEEKLDFFSSILQALFGKREEE